MMKSIGSVVDSNLSHIRIELAAVKKTKQRIAADLGSASKADLLTRGKQRPRLVTDINSSSRLQELDKMATL